MKNKNKVIIVVVLVFIVALSVFSACGTQKPKFASDSECEKQLEKIQTNGAYAFQQGYIFSQGGKSIDFSTIAEDYLLENKLLEKPYRFYYSNHAYFISGNFVYLLLRFQKQNYGNYTTAMIKINKSNVFDYKILGEGDKNHCPMYEIQGGYVCFLANVERDFYCYNLQTWQRELIVYPKVAGAQSYANIFIPAVNNKALYFVKKHYAGSNYSYEYYFVDETFEKHYLKDINGEVLFITENYVLFSNGEWFDFKTALKVSKKSTLDDLAQKYENYINKKEQEKGSTNTTFLYNGNTYIWENDWEQATDGSYISKLVVVNIETQQKYYYSYQSIQQEFSSVYNVYPSLAFSQVFVQNGELYIVLARYGGKEELCSNKLVFKYNEQNKKLEYLGFAVQNQMAINNVLK